VLSTGQVAGMSYLLEKADKRLNMKNKNTKLVFGLIMLIFAFFITCSNPIMEKWWPETDTIIPNEKSGVNFAVVFLDTKGGSPQPYPIRVLWGDTIPRIRAITHPDTDLGFDGWRDERGLQWDINTRRVTQQDDADNDGIIVLTAQWKPNYVTVQFQTNYDILFGASSNFPKNQNGQDIVTPAGLLITTPGTMITVQKIIPGAKIVEPSVLPTNGIHGLVGWYYGGKKWNFAEDTVGDTDIILNAEWSTYIRTIHLQVNGGTRPNGQELTRVNFTVFTGLDGSPGGKIIDPGPLAREGYTFAGWYTDRGEAWDFATSLVKEVDVLDSVNYNPTRLVNNVFTLNARWVPNIYYVTFDTSGGTPIPARQEIMHGNRVVNPPPITLAEMAFNGWVDDAGVPWDFNKGVTRTMTLFATWVPRVYTVRFHLGTPPGGLHSVFITPPEQRVGAVKKVAEPFMPALPAGTINYYSFLGWYSSVDPTTDPGIILNENELQRDISLQKWDFNDTVGAGNTHNDVLNLYARWVPYVPDMVWVPRGNFVMGDAGVSGSPAAYHAYPTRQVTLDGFYISKYQITQYNDPPLRTDSAVKGYNDVMGMNPSQFTVIRTRPVERVSWFDAIKYCHDLTIATPGLTQVYAGFSPIGPPVTITATATSIQDANFTPTWTANGFRLPTEAEWEYAARGGHNMLGNYVYAGSNNANDVAWFNTTVATQDAGATQMVGRLAPNALGIFDMSGNVSEWVWDSFASYKDSYYSTPAASLNPRGPSGDERVRRGGGWSNAVSNVRCVVRNSDTPKTAHWVVGFRVARGPSNIW